MNSRTHNTATKMGVGAFLSPFQGSRGRETTQGSAFGSTPGYIPAAASRLKGFAIFPGIALLLLVAGCSGTRSASDSGALTIPVRLPDGAVIDAEPAMTPQQRARGLMFRNELAADRGMIFMFPDESPQAFWMYNTLIPLDIIWMNADRRIVFISANTPPCPSPNQAECRNYGEGFAAQYVLELAAGQAAAHGLQVGDRPAF